MATIGQQLRKAREAQQLSKATVSEQTKINKEFIEALENDDYQAFNEEFYIKQYIRTYAYYLGLDAHALVDHIGEDDYEAKGEIHVSQLLFEQKRRKTEKTQREFKTMDVLQKIFFGFFIVVLLVVLWWASIKIMPQREFQRPGTFSIGQKYEKTANNLS